MKTKTVGHTPGPWKVEGKDDHHNLMTGDGRLIAIIHGQRPAIIQDSKNAALIASAPELLEALKELNNYVHKQYGNHGPLSLWDKVRNAITKAEAK